VEVDLDLLATWIGDAEATPVIDEASVALVRERTREQAARAALGEVQAGAIVTAASELAHNQLRHAGGGVVVVREARCGEELGVEVVAADNGPGIADVEGALAGRQAHAGSLGAGLSGVFALADEVDLDVRLLEGTCVWARKFRTPPAVRRPRVGVCGRPFPGERLSGDDAAFVRERDVLAFCVVDGLGHGEPARQASARAARLLLERPGAAPDALLRACDPVLARTRGAVMTAGRLDGGGVALAGVGNVSARAFGASSGWRFGGSSFFLGSGHPVLRIQVERHPLAALDVMTLFTDGIRSSVDLGGEHDLLREHPIVVAQQVVARHGRGDDDILVMVIG
jgi:anti-sigma regulatory factor (Ser/Thr protein kinase)